MATTEDGISCLRAARLAFRKAGKRSLELACDDMISEAQEELASDQRIEAHERRIVRFHDGRGVRNVVREGRIH